MKKLCAALFMAVSITAGVYAELLFDLDLGWLFLTEKYEEAAEAQYVHGPYSALNFAVYPGRSFAGFFAVSASGVPIDPGDIFSMDSSFAIGPAFIWRLNPKTSAGISIGPVYSYANYGGLKNITGGYGLGLYGDISFVFRTGKRVFLKAGVAGKWTFLRGVVEFTTDADGTMSATDIEQVGYYGFGIAPYIGIGLSFMRNY